MDSNTVSQVGDQIASGLQGVAGSMAGPLSTALIAAMGLGAVIVVGTLIWRVFKRQAK